MGANILERNKLFPNLARSSPKLALVFAIIYCMAEPSNNSFYVLFVVVLTSLLNVLFKYIVAKPLYKLSGTNTLPILGSGSRPPGATSCGTHISGKNATSFGMPSGHSQIAWTMGTYLICRLFNKMLDNNDTNNTTHHKILFYIWNCISIGIILVSMIYISYSRVYIEGCHTIQQVIIGGMLGSVIGFLAFYFEKSILTGMKLK